MKWESNVLSQFMPWEYFDITPFSEKIFKPSNRFYWITVITLKNIKIGCI